jgi:hypothetical protein
MTVQFPVSYSADLTENIQRYYEIYSVLLPIRTTATAGTAVHFSGAIRSLIHNLFVFSSMGKL